MNTDRELMRQWLDDLCGSRLCSVNSMSSRREAERLIDGVITAMRERLAHPVQEPVPNGWQLVPKEPTPGMLDAIARTVWPDDWHAGKNLQLEQTKRRTPLELRVPSCNEDEAAVGRYLRLLAASPTPPQQPRQENRFGVTQPYTADEIIKLFESHEYSAELLLQHAIIHLERQESEIAAEALEEAAKHYDSMRWGYEIFATTVADELRTLAAQKREQAK